MRAADRARLLAGLRGTETLLVLDETLVELTLSGPPALTASAVDAPRVVRLGSLSKSVWGGLRIGWIRADRAVIQRLAQSRASIDLGTPILEQLAAVELLNDAGAALAVRRPLLRARRGPPARTAGGTSAGMGLSDARRGIVLLGASARADQFRRHDPGRGGGSASRRRAPIRRRWGLRTSPAPALHPAPGRTGRGGGPPGAGGAGGGQGRRLRKADQAGRRLLTIRRPDRPSRGRGRWGVPIRARRRGCGRCP